MLVCNLNNNRSRPKAWMRESVWSWHLIHTDTYAMTRPEFGILEDIVKSEFKIAIGCNSSATSQQGPPKDLCMENLGGKLNTNFNDHWSSLSGLELRDNDNKKFRANDKLTRVQVNY